MRLLNILFEKPYVYFTGILFFLGGPFLMAAFSEGETVFLPWAGFCGMLAIWGFIMLILSLFGWANNCGELSGVGVGIFIFCIIIITILAPFRECSEGYRQPDSYYAKCWRTFPNCPHRKFHKLTPQEVQEITEVDQKKSKWDQAWRDESPYGYYYWNNKYGVVKGDLRSRELTQLELEGMDSNQE